LVQILSGRPPAEGLGLVARRGDSVRGQVLSLSLGLRETLKGLCHEMNFLKVLKIKSVLFVYALIVFKFFHCLVMEKIKD
jgi:hypothetical protein